MSLNLYFMFKFYLHYSNRKQDKAIQSSSVGTDTYKSVHHFHESGVCVT